jgi:hypothetical protein
VKRLLKRTDRKSTRESTGVGLSNMFELRLLTVSSVSGVAHTFELRPRSVSGVSGVSGVSNMSGRGHLLFQQ